jgi:hypothetical protein
MFIILPLSSYVKPSAVASHRRDSREDTRLACLLSPPIVHDATSAAERRLERWTTLAIKDSSPLAYPFDYMTSYYTFNKQLQPCDERRGVR